MKEMLQRRHGLCAVTCLVGATALAVGLMPRPADALQFAVPRDIDELIEPGEPLGDTPEELVAAGFKVFTEETFEANGRTCATCHPVTNNFTIGPDYIATLPDDDPLFVAEFDPALSELEDPDLQRTYGLILENHDGFGEPPVFRSVAHNIGLSQSVTPDDGDEFRPEFMLNGATGWSGDGSPEDGSLRFFLLGAIIQHFTKSLDRIACSTSDFDDPATSVGCDFRVPTDAELDAVLAFLNFLGRQNEYNIAPDDPDALVFDDPRVEEGKVLFHGVPNTEGGTFACAFCHSNAGANDADGNNRQFSIGTEVSPFAPACRKEGVVGDGGFGPFRLDTETIECADGPPVTVDFRGDSFFNTPSLIEAADTGPYFSANIADTLEEAVTFYTTEPFAQSRSGGGAAFALSEQDTNLIGALLRALNALDNLINSSRYLDFALEIESFDGDVATQMVELAASEATDVIDVLTDGPLLLFPGVQANGVSLLTRVRQARSEERAVLEEGLPLDADRIAAAKRAIDDAVDALLVE